MTGARTCLLRCHYDVTDLHVCHNAMGSPPTNNLQLYSINWFNLIQIVLNRSIWPLDRTLTNTIHLGPNETESNDPILPRFLDLEPRHQIQFSVIPRIPLPGVGILSLSRRSCQHIVSLADRTVSTRRTNLQLAESKKESFRYQSQKQR